LESSDHAHVTMSATVDVSDSLDEARTRLLRTARALNGAWAAALCSMATLVVASMALLVVASTVRPVYVVIWSVLLAATGYNLTRFWPRRVDRRGVRLSKEERVALRGFLDPHGAVAWPDVVRLVPWPELELAEGELVLGMPLVACLDQTELHELLMVAAMQASVEQERSVRWAFRVAHGEIGRPLVGRRDRPTWTTSRLTELLRSRAAALEADLDNWAGACERAAVRAHRSTAAAQASRDQVADAWALMRTEWLDPAFARGRRHVAPFTGLRHFVEGAAAAGWLSERPWWSPTGLLADLVDRYEGAVALQLDGRAERLAPITWEQHPAEVGVADWRLLVAEVLDAARRTSYDAAVNLDSVLLLLEHGEGPALAWATAADRGIAPAADAAYPEWSEKFVSRVLTAAISIAAIDSRHFRPRWSWPHGTQLVADDGWTLPVESIVSDVLGMVRDGHGLDKAYAELREALEALDIDVHEPLWLDHGPNSRPERPIGSFAARQGLAARLVVVTDRSLHVFRDPKGARLARLMRPVSPRRASIELRKRMLKVWQGDVTDQVLTVTANQVRRARVGPATGGLWWRLTLNTTDGTVVLRGRGDGLEEESEVREWLGERVRRTWLDAAPAVRSARNAVGLGGAILGTVALVVGVLLTILRPDGMPEPLPVALAVGGFAALVLAVLPDAVAELTHRIRT
jgi:hypothetical protein